VSITAGINIAASIYLIGAILSKRTFRRARRPAVAGVTPALQAVHSRPVCSLKERYRSSGVRPVRFAMRASIRGPSSSRS